MTPTATKQQPEIAARPVVGEVALPEGLFEDLRARPAGCDCSGKIVVSFLELPLSDWLSPLWWHF